VICAMMFGGLVLFVLVLMAAAAYKIGQPLDVSDDDFGDF